MGYRLINSRKPYKRVWGEPPGAMLRQHWRRWIEMVHPGDCERAVDGMERSLRGETFAQEYRIVRPDGSYRWVRDTMAVRRDPNGSVALDGVTADISEKHGLEMQLRENEERFRTFVELAREGVLSLDAAGRITYLNGAAQRFLGQEEDALRTLCRAPS